MLYVVFYAVALTDVYCFVKFDSTLTPTMLLLVGETDEREAGEALRFCTSTSYFTYMLRVESHTSAAKFLR